MARVVVSEFVTLDGVFEDPGGAENSPAGGWAFRFDRGPEGDRFKADELLAAEALLLGRLTYEGFAEAWPSRAGSDQFADRMNSLPKYVVSSRLTDPAWANSSVLAEKPMQAVGSLRERLTGDILVAGSGRLVGALAGAGLIDELRLMIFPIVIGRGRRLFEDAPEASFRPTSVQSAGDCTIITLEPRPAA